MGLRPVSHRVECCQVAIGSNDICMDKDLSMRFMPYPIRRVRHHRIDAAVVQLRQQLQAVAAVQRYVAALPVGFGEAVNYGFAPLLSKAAL